MERHTAVSLRGSRPAAPIAAGRPCVPPVDPREVPMRCFLSRREQGLARRVRRLGSFAAPRLRRPSCPSRPVRPRPIRPWRPTYRLGGVTALALLLGGAVSFGLGSGQPPALASIVHGSGFMGSVLGMQAWYGSYGVGNGAYGWCFDAGIKAPDPSYDYRPVEVHDRSPDVQAAISW